MKKLSTLSSSLLKGTKLLNLDAKKKAKEGKSRTRHANSRRNQLMRRSMQGLSQRDIWLDSEKMPWANSRQWVSSLNHVIDQ